MGKKKKKEKNPPKPRKQLTKPHILIQLSNCTDFVFYYISVI